MKKETNVHLGVIVILQRSVGFGYVKEKCSIQYQQMKIIKVSPMNDIENKLTNSSVVKYSKVLFSGGVFIIDNEL